LLCSISKGNRLCCSQERFKSSFLRRIHGAHETSKNDPEAVIKEFESHSSLHANPSALYEYVKALAKVDRLDQSEFLLKTLQRGLGMNEEVQPSVESNTRFKDVKGAYSPKAKLKEIVEYLRDPECFARLGVKFPKGYLLAGPTGTGKTMLATAVAGETGVPFFSCKGHEFETHFGDGAQRMRDLFAAAKKRSPSIIFIDDIDQIHTKRTLNQLTVELDGLKQKSGIIVIAATDVPDSLDKALVEHGRFDRRVDVPKPGAYEKQVILKSLMSKVPKANDVNLKTIADSTYQFSGADLANIVNHAALEAARDGAKVVTFRHLFSAMRDITRLQLRKDIPITKSRNSY
jgi:ATP-dependent metalloprotease